MIIIDNEKKCSGCRTCEDACPKQCISMKKGTLGHLFPTIDYDKCISCNICSSVCPIQSNSLKGNASGKIYTAFSKDKEIRKISSSGGVFYSFASYYNEHENYWVFGSCFNEQLQLKTVGVEKASDILQLCKSKYIQSDTSGIYKKIKQLLENDIGVLYCGTPCQIAGLKLFLKKDYQKLLLIDFFCHGVPSQEYFNKCKELVESKKKIKIVSYSFRTKKENGVTPHYYTVKYLKNGKQKEKIGFYYESPFYAAFQSYINLRESCYNCIFANNERFSDITIGDFHDVEQYKKGIDRFDGVSLLIVNTDKGHSALQKINDEISLDVIDKSKLISDEVIFTGGTSRPDKRDKFINDYNEYCFSDLNKKWFNKRKYIKQMIYYHFPKSMRKTLKRMSGIK